MNLSLRKRLFFSAIILLVLFVWLAAFALQNAYERSAQIAHKEALTGYLYALLAASDVDQFGNFYIAEEVLGQNFSVPGSGLYATVYDSELNTIVWSSISTLGVNLPNVPKIDTGTMLFYADQNQSDNKFFVLNFGVSWQLVTEYKKYVFSVSEDLSRYQNEITGYKRTLWFWLLLLGTLLLVVQSMILHWGLKPLRKVAQEIRDVEQGRKSSLEGEYPKELRRLTSNINALVGNERKHLKRYRNTLADLAHSLKTPLAVLQNHFTDIDLQKDNGSRIAYEQVGRMQDIVDYQLQKAAVSGKRTFSAPMPIKTVVEKVVNALDKAYSEKNIQTIIDIDEGVIFYGEQGDLMEVIGNLSENAYKWTGSKVIISAENFYSRSESKPSLRLSVEDDGPGFPENIAHDILERGVRGDMTEGPPGQGIGLSVVNDIVTSYEGRLNIDKSSIGGSKIEALFGSH